MKMWTIQSLCLIMCVYRPLYASIPPHGTRADVHLAVILPIQDETSLFSRHNVEHSIDLAINKVNEYGLLPHHRLVVHYRESMCNSANAPLAAFDLYDKNKTSVFIGPVCDYSLAPVARYARVWNIPVISPGAMSFDFGANKSPADAEYGTLVRVGWTFDVLSDAVHDIFVNHKWQKVKMLYERYGCDDISHKFCYLAISSIVKTMRTRNEVKHDVLMLYGTEDYDKILRDEVGAKYGVIVILASPGTLRELMLAAQRNNFINGEYVFVNIDLYNSKAHLEQPWTDANDTNEGNEKAKQAYSALLTVTTRRPVGENDLLDLQLHSEDNTLSYDRGVKYNASEDSENSFADAFHDGVIMYATALNETLEKGGHISDGKDITMRMWNKNYLGVSGNMFINDNGDRLADFSLLSYRADQDKFVTVSNYLGGKHEYKPVQEIEWVGGQPPLTVPECGFDRSNCPDPPDPAMPEYAIVILAIGSLLIVVAIMAFALHKHYQFDESQWKIKWEDITSPAMDGHHFHNYMSETHTTQMFMGAGTYNNDRVAITRIPHANITPSKGNLRELRVMRDMHNDHIVAFLGVCIDARNPCIITAYCQRGSLHDILGNEQVKLDHVFKHSLIQDIIRGMAYLHSTDIRSHGNLKTSNCLIDKGFMVKISDFGLHNLRTDEHGVRYHGLRANGYGVHNGHHDSLPSPSKTNVWRAPELLRLTYPPSHGTPRADVYSFAIICHEILFRNGPFWVCRCDDQETCKCSYSEHEICANVRSSIDKPFRPTINPDLLDIDINPDVIEILEQSWAEEPGDRPTFGALKVRVAKFTNDKSSGNILDNLLRRMEQHSDNLEDLVKERTANYLQEKERAEEICHRLLPKKVAYDLMHGQKISAEKFDLVTMYFSDICGFTKIGDRSTAKDIMILLDDLYRMFDKTMDDFECYKVETIGDAYEVVSGLPVRNGIKHAQEIARMSLAFLKRIQTFRIKHLPDEQLKLRIGLHSGLAYAGVVGHLMPRYCLFGDTVNLVQTMESSGLPMKIHVSSKTRDLLLLFETFILTKRTDGEGLKDEPLGQTYWLEGEIHREDTHNKEIEVKPVPEADI